MRDSSGRGVGGNDGKAYKTNQSNKQTEHHDRYKLLLSALIGQTSEVHSDRVSLQLALQQITEIATYVNEKSRENEKFLRVVRLQEELGMKDLVKPSRKMVKEGQLQKIKLNEKGHVPCRLYLFNDLLLCIKGQRLQTISGLRRIEMPLVSELKIRVESIEHNESKRSSCTLLLFRIFLARAQATKNQKSLEKCIYGPVHPVYF